MAVTAEGTPEQQPTRRRKLLRGLVAAWLLFIIIYGGYQYIYPYPVGPAQPIPFSHAIHAGEREISCLFCHDSADRSSDAGMPAVSKCVLCHQAIITRFPQIQEELSYYARKEPVPWIRVYRLPDYVRFTHVMHINRRIDCGQCHGNVKEMDRIQQAMQLKMGVCIACHRSNGASVDCYTCHY